MWSVIRKRLPHAVCYDWGTYRGKRVMIVWTLVAPSERIAQPVSLFDPKTYEWVADGFA